MSTMLRASVASENQLGRMPKSWSRIRLISPRFSLNRPRNTGIEMKAGTAYGRNSITR